MTSWNMSSASGPPPLPTPGGDNFGQSQQPPMHLSHTAHSYSGDTTPTLNHLLQSNSDPRHNKSTDPTASASNTGLSASYNRDDYQPTTMNPPVGKGEPYDSSQSMSYMSMQHHHHHQQQVGGWGSHPRGGGHPYMYQPQGPGSGPSNMYPIQPGGGSSSEMSQGRRPPMGGVSPYPQSGAAGGQYMGGGGQQMAMGPGGPPGPHRFMMPGQMPNQMYNQSQMYMPNSQQQPPQQQQLQQQPPQQQQPAPSVSPAVGRALTPQLQQMQNMISNSPKQPSPAPSISSDHGSTQSQSSKPGEDGPDIKSELPVDESGDNQRGNNPSRNPAPSPVGSTGSRSNTPAPIPGTQCGSPMPVRPPSGQIDGQTNRMTQSPMATQAGYGPGMMPPPNSMGYMPPNAGKMPGHYPQYNTSQYPPQGNYNRQQPGMGGPMAGNYQQPPGMYPNGPQQMPGGYGGGGGPAGNMGWNMPPHSGYGPGPYQSGANTMMGGGGQQAYPGYGMPGQQPPPHNMQQQQQGMPPGSTANTTMPPGSNAGPMPPNMGNQQQQSGGGANPMMPQTNPNGGPPMNKAAQQAAQAAMMAAANSSNSNPANPSPRMPHSRTNSMSPSRGMFGGGPLAQMNNMTNSPNLGSPSLNSMSNAVEQLSRNASSTPSSIGSNNMNTNSNSTSMMSSGSIPSPGPSKMSGGHPETSNGPTPHHHHPSPSPLSNPDVANESLSRPNSTTAIIHPTDLPAAHDTTSSESSSGMPSDSTSVDSGFHSSSDQGEKTSDSVNNTPNQVGGNNSPPLPHSSSSSSFTLHQNGETGRSLENITPPSSSSSVPTSRTGPGHDPNKMPYINEGGNNGIPLPPTSLSSSMAPMPPMDHCVTTTATFGHPTPSVTQSIPSPVTSSTASSHPHPSPQQQQHMGHPQQQQTGMMNPMAPHPHGPHGGPTMPNGMMNPGAGHHMRPHHQPMQQHQHPGLGSGGGMMMGAGGAGPGPNMNMNMNQNGPMMGGPPMMGHGPNGGMMPPGSMGNSMPPHMGQGMPPQHPHQHPHQQQPMPPHGQHPQHMQQQQPNPMQQQQSPMVNNHPEPGEDKPPVEKKRKVKDMESPLMHRSGYPGAHYSEEPNSPGVPKSSSDISKLFDMGPEPDRRQLIEAVLANNEENGNPITSMPSISKTHLDLYKLYYSVREKGGFEEVTRNKKWREVCTVVNIGTSASAAFTLKKNYIRYLFNYECKFDRGGQNPGPILAQMEAQMSHKRDSKNKRVPSPGSQNSNDAFRPPSTPNSQIDGGPPYPGGPGMPPPYMQNPDGSGGNGMMMGGPPGPPQGMMGPGGPMMGGMMGGPPPMGQQAGPGMGPMMGGPHHPGYGPPPPHHPPPMIQQQPMPVGHPGAQQQQPPQTSTTPIPPNSSGSSPMPPHVAPTSSDSISVQDPFSDESSNNFNRTNNNNVPPPSGTPVVSTMMSSSVAAPTPPPAYSSMSNSSAPHPPAGMMSTAAPSAGSTGTQMTTAMPPNRPNEQQGGTAGAQFPFGQQFDQPDRFDQSSPSSQAMRHPIPPSSSSSMAPSPPTSDGTNNIPPYQQTTPGGPRFPGPHPPPSTLQSQYPPYHQGPGGPTPPSPYPPGPPGPYQGYPPANVPPPGPYTPGPRPPVSSTPGVYGTPTRRYPDAADGGRDGQWSPLQRPRMHTGAPGYMSPGPPPSTPPMPSFGRTSSGPRSSPHSRGSASQKGNKASFPSMIPGSMSKKELMFPADTVEGVSISMFKRKKLTSKDLAPFEAWRLMLALKSGLLAESTWALDTLNILLYDDSTHSYFSLSTLPGLLEVLTEHLRHCLMQIFSDFDDLEEGFKKPARHFAKRLNGKRLIKSFKSQVCNDMDSVSTLKGEECMDGVGEKKNNNNKEQEIGAAFQLEGTNYTLASRKGLPVKFDLTPCDSSVLESKGWDLYKKFEKTKDHWMLGCGDLTEHIQTQFESDSTHQFLSGRFYRKRSRLEAGMEDDEEEEDEVESIYDLFAREDVESTLVEEKSNLMKKLDNVKQCGANSSLVNSTNSNVVERKKSNSDSNCISSSSSSDSDPSAKIKEERPSSEDSKSAAASSCNHSTLCNGSSSSSSDHKNGDSSLSSNLVNGVQIKKEMMDVEGESGVSEKKKVDENVCKKENNCDKDKVNADNLKDVSVEDNSAKSKESIPVENGELEEPKLSPMTSTAEMNGDLSEVDGKESKKESKKDDYEEDCPPPVLKAECMDVDVPDTQILDDSQNGDDDDGVEGEADAPTLPLNSTLNNSSNGEAMDTDGVMDASQIEKEEEEGGKKSEDVKKENGEEKEKCEKNVEEKDLNVSKDVNFSLMMNESFVSETEEMSVSFVADLMKEEDCTEEEAFQRDDPPLCVTVENRDELGRRCVCILNILRSLSNVAGNEAQLCKHAGVMKILGRLLLLHHSHPKRPPPRKLPKGEEEEKEQPPRVYDDEHWWWDYLDQLRENTLVILANICSHLMLDNFSEKLCQPLLEGLLHWVICPASVARDPLPTLSPGSSLSPQRLVLEALCKLCIHETNVDLLLATPPMKRLLELFAVLIHLLADREHQITREFSIVLLSLLVQGDSSVARALALQHPCVSVLVDFLETAEKNALNIANQQGISALQSNPEAMGTSLDMLRRAASILLHMARVPDNRRLFVQQQNRLLNLVMSQILDQSVANTLSEVLFECSQVS